MGFWIKFAAVLFGAFLFLLGIFKAWWEVKSWEVLSKLGERPALIGNDPRVEVRLFIFVAAVGLSMLILAVLW